MPSDIDIGNHQIEQVQDINEFSEIEESDEFLQREQSIVDDSS